MLWVLEEVKGLCEWKAKEEEIGKEARSQITQGHVGHGKESRFYFICNEEALGINMVWLLGLGSPACNWKPKYQWLKQASEKAVQGSRMPLGIQALLAFCSTILIMWPYSQVSSWPKVAAGDPITSTYQVQEGRRGERYLLADSVTGKEVLRNPAEWLLLTSHWLPLAVGDSGKCSLLAVHFTTLCKLEFCK